MKKRGATGHISVQTCSFSPTIDALFEKGKRLLKTFVQTSS